MIPDQNRIRILNKIDNRVHNKIDNRVHNKIQNNF